MPDWSIKFVPAKTPKPGVLAEFVLDDPDNAMGNPGDPRSFNVYSADNVSWNNTTPNEHWPAVYPPGAAGGGRPAGEPQPIGDPLKQHKSSHTYSVGAEAPSTIWFCCKLHPNEVGILKVIAPGAAAGV